MSRKNHTTKTSNSPVEIRALKLDEIEIVSGGFSSSFSAVSEVLKNFGNALQTAARGG